mmetsp:Transcript_55957/g.146967  ORF Transcript_55957/g.146967 Transcript_55957/m.146967 type:complete len:319 (-) Transcript_55957:437-1393(-)
MPNARRQETARAARGGRCVAARCQRSARRLPPPARAPPSPPPLPLSHHTRHRHSSGDWHKARFNPQTARAPRPHTARNHSVHAASPLGLPRDTPPPAHLPPHPCRAPRTRHHTPLSQHHPPLLLEELPTHKLKQRHAASRSPPARRRRRPNARLGRIGLPNVIAHRGTASEGSAAHIAVYREATAAAPLARSDGRSTAHARQRKKHHHLRRLGSARPTCRPPRACDLGGPFLVFFFLPPPDVSIKSSSAASWRPCEPRPPCAPAYPPCAPAYPPAYPAPPPPPAPPPDAPDWPLLPAEPVESRLSMSPSWGAPVSTRE